MGALVGALSGLIVVDIRPDKKESFVRASLENFSTPHIDYHQAKNLSFATMSRRATKRRRHQHSYTSYGFHSSSNSTSNEERLLHQTIQNSKLGDARGTRGALGNKIEVPWGPVFFPSIEEMEGSPLDYIDKIRPVAQRYGICKIVPPEGWKRTDFFGKCELATGSYLLCLFV